VCEKCDQIDLKIAWYQRLCRNINDEQTLTVAKGLIAELEAQKKYLHPESEEK
jgi:hypothetical protein